MYTQPKNEEGEEFESQDAEYILEEKNEKSNKNNTHLGRYKDDEGLTIQKMQFGLWWVAHRTQLSTILKISLIIIVAIIWGNIIYNLSAYILFGMKADQELARSLTAIKPISHEIILKQAPEDLRLYEVMTLEPSENSYDFIMLVKNINEKHAGSFNFSFIVNNEIYISAENFILPGETKYFASLGNELEIRPSSVEAVIDKSGWKRIDAHDYPDWSDFYSKHFNIDISDIQFTPAKATTLSEKVNLNKLQFKVLNNTAYNYHYMDFVILLKNLDKIISLNKYRANNLMSGEERIIDITMPGRFGRIDVVVITPELDITRDDIYIGFEAGPSKDY